MAYVVVGDFHAHPFTEFSRSLDAEGLSSHGRRILDTASWLADLSPELLIVNGDYTTTPGYLDGPTLRLLGSIEQRWHGMARVLNLGNHDCSSKSGLHNLELHAALGGHVQVVKPDTVLYEHKTGVHIVPYTFSIESQRALLATIPDGARVMIHYPLISVRMSPFAEEATGLDPEELSRFRWTVASHYHLPQLLHKGRTTLITQGCEYIPPQGSILVTGTPLAHSFGDTNLAYGAWKVSGDNFIFLENPHSPTYLTKQVSSVAQAKAVLREQTKLTFVTFDADAKVAAALRKLTTPEHVLGVRVRELREDAAEERLDVSHDQPVTVVVEKYLAENPPDKVTTPALLKYLQPILDSTPKPTDIGGKLDFAELTVSNFLSWEQATLQLGTVGLVLVSGVNNDSQTATSNGSGKSSLLEALVWALYNETFRGVSSDDVIRKGAKGCVVQVCFTDGTNSYTVKRYRKDPQMGTGVSLLVNGEDASKSLAAETNKEIVRILGMDKDTFAILSFLGQGFDTRFSQLNDAGKKRLLEAVLGVSYYDDIKAKLDSRAKQDLQRLESTTSQIGVLKSSIESRVARIEEEHSKAITAEAAKMAEATTIAASVQEMEQAIATLSTLRAQKDAEYIALLTANSVLREQAELVDGKYTQANDELQRAKMDWARKNTIAANWVRKLKEYAKEQPSDVCDACGQPLSKESKAWRLEATLEALEKDKVAAKAAQEAEAQAEREVIAAQTEFQRYAVKKQALLEKWNSFTAQVDGFRSVLDAQSQEIRELSAKVDKYRRELDRLEAYDPWVVHNTLLDSLTGDRTTLDKLTQECQEYTKSAQMSSAAAALFGTKSLRSYVLDEGIKQLNAHLAATSGMIFGSDYHVSIKSTTTKKNGKEDNSISVDFATPGGSYLSASGGERRKADLAIHLALSQLALAVGRGSTNLLIADEVLDTLDFVASKAVVDALDQVAKTKKVFLISHSPEIRSLVPDVLLVQKQNGISSLAEV